MDEDVKLLTQKAAAEMIGRGEKQIRAWLNAGKLPFVQEPGCSRRYILRSDLIAFIRSNRKAAENGTSRHLADN